MNPSDRWTADAMRALLIAKKGSHQAFHRALLNVDPWERDAWVDRVLSLDGVTEDGPELPRGCTPYIPCPVETVLLAVDQAEIDRRDVFVDVGAGVGRTALLVHLLTGASAIGIEIQSSLVALARKNTQELQLDRVATVCGDASQLAGYITVGSVFFLYCPFNGARLSRLVDALEPLAKLRTLRLCGVHLNLPERPWLNALDEVQHDLQIRSSR